MDESVELKSPDKKGPELGPEAGLEEIDFAPLIDYFGMDRPDGQTKNDLRELFTHLSKSGELSKGELMGKLRAVERRLGAPPTSENRIRRIVNYLALDDQIGDLIKEQASYVRD
jgi:hypothetical protein